jgi:thiamine biosynthesis lipoprotein
MYPNHKLVRLLNIICISIAAVVALTGCGSSQHHAAQSGSYYIFDTMVSVKVYADDVTEQHYEAIEALLERIDQAMNRHKQGSEVDQVNQQAGIQDVPVSAETFMVVQKALGYAALSEGRFDPTIGPLVDLWGIGSDHARVPDDDMLAQKLLLVNYKDIQMNQAKQSIMLARPGMSIDLGAIAKGYAADQVAEYLRSQGFKSALIDLGGNILAMGSKPKQDFWTIGMQNPESSRGDTIGTLRVTNKTIVSSGAYERFFTQDGVRYHHIMNAATGYPVSNNLSGVTIVTEHSIDADALSTTAFAMGLKEGLSFVESQPGVEAFFITNDRIVYSTSGLTNQLNMTDARYTEYKQ